MGIYLKISLAYLKKNKLRTLLLILGVALGVFLVFGTSVMTESKSKNQVELINKIYGGYDLEFKDVNFEGTEKLNNDEQISEIITVKNLGNVVDKNGNSFPLKSADEEYIANKAGELIKGELPSNINEIVMEERALEAMNIPLELGTTIEFKIKRKYIDSEGNEKLYTDHKEFELVGIIGKPKDYYDVFDMPIEYEVLTYDNGEKNIVPQETVTYDSLLKLKSGGINPDPEAFKLMEKNELGQVDYFPNWHLVTKLTDNQIDRDNPNVYKREVLIIITAVVFIFNIFNITLNEMVKEMGLLRQIGASKKKVSSMIVYQALIIMVLGILLGIIMGVLFTHISITKFDYSLYKEADVIPKVYVSQINIIKAVVVGVLSVFISSIIPVIKIGKISPVEATRRSDKLSSNRVGYGLNKLISKVFGFYGFMGVRNIGRNKSRAFISILSIALGGYLYLTTFTSMQNETSEKIENMQERYDVTIEFGENSDEEDAVYTNEDIEKLSSIDGVKSLNPIQIASGIYSSNNTKINEDFAKQRSIDQKDNIDQPMEIKFYTEAKKEETLEDFIQEGSLYNIGQVVDGYVNVAVYNHFNNIDKGDITENVFIDLKVGDVMDIKVPIIENGETIYIESKVMIGAILSPNWMSQGDGSLGRNFEIVTTSNHAKELVGGQKYTKLAINLEDVYDEAVNKEVEEVSNSIHLSKYSSKLSFIEHMDKSSEEYTKSQFSIISLVLIIAAINIFCTIKTNLIVRKKELATFRSLGMSVRDTTKMIAYEGIAYALISFIVALIPSVINLIEYVKLHNKSYKNYGIDTFMEFTFPIQESLIFLVISIIICLVAVITSNRSLKSMNIIDGIRDTE